MPRDKITAEQGIVICERLFLFYQGAQTRLLAPIPVDTAPDLMAYANYRSGKITIINYGTTPISLDDCYMEPDMFANRYQFPAGLTLEPGQTIYVLTGSSAKNTPLSADTFFWTNSVLFNKEIKSYTGKIFTSEGKVLIPVTMQIILEAK
jgi:hypothetical protein